MQQSLKREVWKNIWESRELYVIFFIPFVYYVLFRYLPIIGGLFVSLVRYRIGVGLLESKWVGLKYFKQFLDSIFFWRLIRNTLAINLIGLVLGFPLPIIFALLLNELKVDWFKRTVQTISYLPHFISIVIVSSMVITFLSPTMGIVNNLMEMLGFERVAYLNKSEYFWWIYNFMHFWQQTGFGAIIYLAALTGIDPTLYEAATVDGSNRWQNVWHITLPCLMPTIVILLLMRVGRLLMIGQEAIILLYNPTTYETADVISSYVYRRGLLNADYSFATAIGLFQSVLGFILLMAMNTITKRVSEHSLW
jgi:putative aldouronate transport system permease protein